jgi:predicted transcriptional regulator
VLYMEQPQPRAVAEVVKGAHDEAGLSCREVSRRTGIPLSTLAQRVSGKRPFNLDQFAQVAEVLEMRPSALYSKAEDAP